jgi:hypothetical protein
MIQFSINGTLPSGIHLATLSQAEPRLAFNPHRRKQFSGIERAGEILWQVGCLRIYIGGSFATNKEFLGDFDCCWDDDNVDFVKLKGLDPVLLDFKNHRAAQKAKYGGELFPAGSIAVRMVKLFWNSFSKTEMGILKALLPLISN